MGLPIEICCNCRDATGRAGRADDSIFVCEGEIGPLCEPCYKRLRDEMVAESEVEAELSALKQRVEALEKLLAEAEEMVEQGKEDAEHLDAEYGNVEDYSHIDAWLARARTFITAEAREALKQASRG